MTLQLIAIAAGIVIGWIRKGSLLSLTSLKLKWLWLGPAAYVLQAVSIGYVQGYAYKWLLIGSYILLLVFCLKNIHVIGILWTSVGTAANFLVMSVNGLRMPAYLTPVYGINKHMATLIQNGEFGKSVAMSSSTHLNFLGDIFLLKIQPPALVSIGDILFAIGIAVLIQGAMKAKKVLV